MQINLTGHHVDITDSLREYVNNKFKKVERYCDKMSNIYVVLVIEKNQQIAEATLHISGAEVHAKAESTDMYSSIDSLIQKITRQVSKYKGKNIHH